VYSAYAEELLQQHPFRLNATDLIAIAAKAKMFIPNLYQRQEFEGMLSCVYAVQGSPDDTLQTLPRFFIENSRLPEGLSNTSIQYLYEGVKHLKKIREEIDSYIRGGGETLAQLSRKAFAKGDTQAMTAFGRKEAYVTAHMTPVLADLQETSAIFSVFSQRVEAAVNLHK
jgi:hypothetical protein